MKIILDGMGGDHAPNAIIDGAVQALAEYPELEIAVTGPVDRLRSLLPNAADLNRIELVPAEEVVQMDDEPVRAVREKKDSSLVRAFDLLAAHPDAMLISAGNTGALVAGAMLLIQRIPGVKRPALAPVIPTRSGMAVLIDGGANAECKPLYLAQFGVMGSVFMQKVYGVPDPRVALVNNGSEPGKGTPLTRDAYKLLQKAPIRFVGNVEGRDLLSGQFDVLVTDGFTGNILLKFTEGCTKTLLNLLRQEIDESLTAKLGALLMKDAFGRLRTRMDYKEYGGALLLGVHGGVMKAHGSSDGQAICAAISTARSFLTGNVVNSIEADIRVLEEQFPRKPESPRSKDAAKGSEKAERSHTGRKRNYDDKRAKGAAKADRSHEAASSRKKKNASAKESK